jgi:hypothetical protein
MTMKKRHRHVDLRVGSVVRIQRRLRARRGPDERRALLSLVRRNA